MVGSLTRTRTSDDKAEVHAGCLTTQYSSATRRIRLRPALRRDKQGRVDGNPGKRCRDSRTRRDARAVPHLRDAAHGKAALGMTRGP